VLWAQDETPAAAAKANVAAAVEEDEDEDSSDEEDDDEVRGAAGLAVPRGVLHVMARLCLMRSQVGAEAGCGCGLHAPGAHGAC
jgi:proteasome assembly chaperone (PAC2) family protein